MTPRGRPALSLVRGTGGKGVKGGNRPAPVRPGATRVASLRTPVAWPEPMHPGDALVVTGDVVQLVRSVPLTAAQVAQLVALGIATWDS